MNHSLRFIGILSALLLLTSCGIFGDDDEEELEPNELLDIETSLKVKRVWSSKIGDGSEYLLVGLRPISDGNSIFAASRDGNVVALDPSNGKTKWKTSLDVAISAGPGSGDGALAVATQDGYLILLDAATGTELWRAYIAGEALAKPLIQDEFVVVQTIDNRLRALSRFDGRQRWSVEQSVPPLTMRGASSPLLLGSAVIAGFDNGRLQSIDIESGDVEWDAMMALSTGRSDLERLADVDGAIAIVGQDVYAAGYQGQIAGVASESGQLLWSRELSTYAGVAADWNSVYSTNSEGELISLSRRTGADNWRNDDLLRRSPTLPIPFHTTVVVGDFEGYLHFYSNLDGEAVARIRYGKKPITSNPLVLANRLYVQSDNGSMAAFEIVDERPKRDAPDVAEEAVEEAVEEATP